MDISKIEKWAEERNFFAEDGTTAKDQTLKLMSEVGELADNVLKGRHGRARDDVGDCMVVLVLVARLIGADLETCLDEAYDEIKWRKGRMVNGTFIKEGDV